MAATKVALYPMRPLKRLAEGSSEFELFKLLADNLFGSDFRWLVGLVFRPLESLATAPKFREIVRQT